MLWVILLTTLSLWFLICERFLFFRFFMNDLFEVERERWEARVDRNNWWAHQIRKSMISMMDIKLSRSIPLIKTLVAACPLLGLLGTVTGMIAVFEVMAVTGTGNPRLMASGVSMATLPTMAGMVAALSGLYFGGQLEARAKREKERFSEMLKWDEE